MSIQLQYTGLFGLAPKKLVGGVKGGLIVQQEPPEDGILKYLHIGTETLSVKRNIFLCKYIYNETEKDLVAKRPWYPPKADEGAKQRIDKKFLFEAEVAYILKEGKTAKEYTGVGKPMSLKPSDYAKIYQAYEGIKRHEGYNYIHKFVHLVLEPLILLSEPCIGSLKHAIMNNFDRATGQRPCLLVEDQQLPMDLITICRQTCAGIDYMHWMGFAHCDIKPENILYAFDKGTQNLHCYITDFEGSAPIESEDAFIQSIHEMDVYTKEYVPPRELMRVGMNVSVVDKYAIAGTILSCLVLVLPNGAKTYRDQMKMIDWSNYIRHEQPLLQVCHNIINAESVGDISTFYEHMKKIVVYS